MFLVSLHYNTTATCSALPSFLRSGIPSNSFAAQLAKRRAKGGDVDDHTGGTNGEMFAEYQLDFGTGRKVQQCQHEMERSTSRLQAQRESVFVVIGFWV